MTRSFLLVLVACGGAPAAPQLSNHTTHEPERDPFASFWANRNRGTATRLCTPEDFTPRPTTAAGWAELGLRCNLDDAVTADNLRALRDFATALAREGYPHDCLDVLASLITPYAGGLSSQQLPADLEPLAEQVLKLGDRCLAEDEERMAMFVAPACPGPDCWHFGPGDDPGDANRGTLVCPVITDDITALVATEGPLASEFCCGVDTYEILTRGGHQHFRVHGSERFIRICGGGTAAETPDGIYRLDGDHLVLEVDRSILWH